MTLQAWKMQTKVHMELFLRQYGWPWSGEPKQKVNDAIMRLIQPMFLSLDRAGLILRGFTYQQLYKVAYDKYVAAKETK